MVQPITITGSGIVSQWGLNSQEAFSQLFSEQEPLHGDMQEFLARIKIREYLSAEQKKIPDIRYMDEVSKKAIIATNGCLQNSGITPDTIKTDPYQYAVLLATKKGPRLTRKKLYDSYHIRNSNSISATLFSNCGYNIAGSLVASFYGIKGINLTLSGSPNSAFSLLKRANNFLLSQRIDTAFVGYSDCLNTNHQDISPISLAEFSCVLCMRREKRRNVRMMSLEFLDEKSISTDFELSEPLKTGEIYGELKDELSTKEGNPALKRLNVKLNKYIAVDKDYLLFIQLGFLWSNDKVRNIFKSWILPIRTKGNVRYIKVLNDIN